MKSARLGAITLLSTFIVAEAMADCQIADAKLEEAILNNPDLRGPANRQAVRDLRSLTHHQRTRKAVDETNRTTVDGAE